MWSDNETEKDFLNFSGVAGTVAEIITQATGRPTSIGISGSWGAGKSSMIKLVRAALAEKDQNDPEQLCLLFIHPPAPWVGSQPCGAKYPGFCADSKGV